MSILENTDLSPEEVLGPPKIDIVGYGLVLFLALVVWLLVGGVIFLLVYFSSWEFLFQSWVLSIIFSMVAFLGMSIGNMMFTWWITIIFPQIYSSTRTLFIQTSVFSIILYIVMSMAYYLIGVYYPGRTTVVAIYAIHTLLNSSFLLILLSILSQYRYVLLAFYSGIISLVVTAIVVFLIFANFSQSAAMIFIFFGLSTTAYVMATLIYFWSSWIYLKLYSFSGSDLLGDVFASIEREERIREIEAEKLLFKK